MNPKTFTVTIGPKTQALLEEIGEAVSAKTGTLNKESNTLELCLRHGVWKLVDELKIKTGLRARLVDQVEFSELPSQPPNPEPHSSHV
jgi:hypothetical protein